MSRARETTKNAPKRCAKNPRKIAPVLPFDNTRWFLDCRGDDEWWLVNEAYHGEWLQWQEDGRPGRLPRYAIEISHPVEAVLRFGLVTLNGKAVNQ